MPAADASRDLPYPLLGKEGNFCPCGLQLWVPPPYWNCRFSPWEPLDTAPEKTGPTRGERIFGSFSAGVEPFAPSSRPLLAAYRGADSLIDAPYQEGGEGEVDGPCTAAAFVAEFRKSCPLYRAGAALD